MANKPKIYGFCNAGCKWETVHKDDFVKSATWVKQYPTETGRYVLSPLNSYKIISPASGSDYSGAVSLEYYNGNLTYVQTFTITEYDEYRAYFYFEILSITADGTETTVVYEVNGNRYTETFNGAAEDITEAKLLIDDATDVFIFNVDASVTVEATVDAAIVQTTGQSETAVMSQKAVTDAIAAAITTALNTEV